MYALAEGVGGTVPFCCPREAARDAAQWRHPAAVLTLPGIDPDCTPVQFESHPQSALWAKVALALMDLGLLSEDKDDPAQTLVRNAIAAWLGRLCGDLQVLKEVISIILTEEPGSIDMGHANLYGEMEESGSVDEDMNGDSGFVIALDIGGQMPWRSLKEPISELQALHPGLGETALHWLYRASDRTLRTVNPKSLFYLCADTYWQGLTDQEDFEAYGEEEPDVEAADDDAVWQMIRSPAAFEASFPKWVRAPEMVIPVETLEELAQGNGKVSRVAACLTRISALIATGASLPSGIDDLSQAYFAAALEWDDADIASRVLDDWIQACNSNCDFSTSINGWEWVELDEVGSVEAWVKRTTHGFQLLREMDELITLVSNEVTVSE